VNASVTLCFEINGGEEAGHHRLVARVFRIDEKGVGLMFNDYDNDTVNALRNVVRQALLAPRHWR